MRMLRATSLDVRLAPLTAVNRGAAALVIAAAMVRNPIHRSVHGRDDVERLLRLERTFAALLRAHGRPGIVALHRGAIAGVAVYGPPGSCPMSADAHERLARELADLPTAGRALHARTAWARRDPAEPHWHLGPIAVAPPAQRLGVGAALLRAVLEEVDTEDGVAYLETDVARNVTWYARHGFESVGEEEVLGVACTFMRRAARSE